MPHVLIAGKIHAAGLDLLRAAKGVSFDFVSEVSVESFLPYLATADAILIRTQALVKEFVKPEKLQE